MNIKNIELAIKEIKNKYGIVRLSEYYTDFHVWECLEDFKIHIDEVEDWVIEYRKDEVLADHFPQLLEIEYEELYNIGIYLYYYFSEEGYDSDIQYRMRKVQDNYFKMNNLTLR